MAFLPSSLLLLIYASSHIPQATLAFPYPRRANSFELSGQLTDFIPTCAQSCFISFLNVNFDSSEIGVFPNLDTLCSLNTTSGYTIGEGAVECIVGEDQANTCSKTGVGGDDGSRRAISKAYNMCSGEKGALPNTHATLVATLFTSGSALLVAPAQSTTTTSSKISTSTHATHTSQHLTSSISQSTAAPTTTFSSVVPLATASGSPTLPLTTSSSTASSATQSSTALPASAGKSSAGSKKGLSTLAKVAITIGSIVGVIAIFGLCLFYRWLRKHRNRDRNRDSDLFPFTPESGNSLAARRFTEYNRQNGQAEKGRVSPGAPGGTRDGVAAKSTYKLFLLKTNYNVNTI